MYGLSAGGLFALLLPLLAARFASGPSQAIHTALILLLLMLFAGGGAGLWLAIRPYRTNRQIARFIGTQKRQLESDLLSAIELGEGGPVPGSPLIEMHLEQTAQKISAFEPKSFVPRRSYVRAMRVALAILLLHVVSVPAFASTLRRGWSHLLSPLPQSRFVDQALFSALDVTIEFPGYTGKPTAHIPDSSGDFRAMLGARVTVSGNLRDPARTVGLLFEEDLFEGATKGSRTFQLSFVVRKGQTYSFFVTDEDGVRYQERIKRRIDIEPDNVPEVTLQPPAPDLEVAELQQIEIGYDARDDFGVSALALVYHDGQRERRIALEADRPTARERRGTYLWDLQPLGLEPGSVVSYHLEARDNDSVSGPKIARSQTFTLRVFSPRERRDEVIASQKEWFEQLLGVLAARLSPAAPPLAARAQIADRGQTLLVELGTLLSALRDDESTAKTLIQALEGMRTRLSKLSRDELALLQRNDLAGHDRHLPAHISELEQDALVLADWIDRQVLEALLSLSDDMAALQDKINKLFEKLEKSGDPAVREELERELQRMERMLAELADKRNRIVEDVLDQFVNQDAMKNQSEDCIGEVRRLLAQGDNRGAAEKMKECNQKFQDAGKSLEKSVAEMRGERFSEEQKQLEELKNELADVSRRQKEIAESMKKADQKQLEAAEKRQGAVEQQTRGLGKKLKDTKDSMPGESGKALQEALDEAASEMAEAQKKAGQKDAAGAEQAARRASERLAEAQQQMNEASRGGQMRGAQNREPVRIPRSDEYRAPREFREELLEAMKKDQAPRGFSDLVKRYYEELIK